ncbi:MAG: hypothetical protein Fur0037_17430 [Planctomycetota bacterium]
MSRTGRDRRNRTIGEDVAAWQLSVHTAVKKTSTLPTAMFDACDPMLEARLCEAADTMFRYLLAGESPASVRDDPSMLRMEHVSQQELRAMMRAFDEEFLMPPERLDPVEGTDRETIAILADCCCSGDEAVRENAARHLLRGFADGCEGDPMTLARELIQLLDLGGKKGSAPDAASIERKCHEIAAAVLGAAARAGDLP